MAFRKDLLTLLSDQPRSASWLARALGLKRTDIEEDLRHAVRSARAMGHTVQVLPARCKVCGFAFDEERLAKPGRCPACKTSRIYEAQILIGSASSSSGKP
jgi:predicted Zn-ribbon and HTH transcriptional regulator